MLLFLVAPALAYEAEPQEIRLEDSTVLFGGQSWYTDWYGTDSLAVQFEVQPHLRADLVMDGLAHLRWPSDLNLELEGTPDSGLLTLTGTYDVVMNLYVEFLGFDFTIPIQLSAIDVQLEDEFDPFLAKDGTATITKKLSDGWEISEDLGGLVATGSVTLDTQTEVNWTGTAWDVEGQELLTPSDEARFAPTGSDREVVAATLAGVLYGYVDGEMSVDIAVCEPSFTLCLNMNAYQISGLVGAEYHERELETGNITFDLPVLETDTSVALGEVRVGQDTTKAVRVFNDGRDTLEVSATLQGAGAMSLQTPTLSLEPGEEGEIFIAFAPTQVSDVSASLVLASSDPARPEVIVAVTGKGVAAPDPNGNNGGDYNQQDDLNAADGRGCGCATTPRSSSLGAAVLALIALVGLRRRS